MARRVAVIGSGPAGLVAAKEASQLGCRVSVFEKASTLGGLWRQPDGATWSTMRTNLSKWTCTFSDYPWAEHAREFPSAPEVLSYLHAYVQSFGLSPVIRFGVEVVSAIPDEAGWSLICSNGEQEHFDSLIVAGGFFDAGFNPLDTSEFVGRVLHSNEYRDELTLSPLVVVGGSMSGIEIAAHAADCGLEVSIIIDRPPWILPRYVAGEDGILMPVDLLMNRRSRRNPASMVATTPTERRRETIQYFEANFGNPSHVNPALGPDVSGQTAPVVAISDSFLSGVSDGRISVHRGRAVGLRRTSIAISSGRELQAEAIVFCTGYRPSLNFFSAKTLDLLEADQNNSLLPIIATNNVIPQFVRNLYFVGMYKGPYFGTMELQARLAARQAAGFGRNITPDIERQRSVRRQSPSPQFPFSYIDMCDSLARELGTLPDLTKAENLWIAEAPVTPAQYRLVGDGAKPEIASKAIEAVRQRLHMSAR